MSPPSKIRPVALVLAVICCLVVGSDADAECDTAACLKAAAFLKRSINFSIDPCRDFYEFSCSKLIAEFANVTWTGIDLASMFTDQQLKVDRDIRDLLEEQPSDLDPNAKRYQTYWKSCMDINSINKFGFDKLVELVQKLGGSPVLGPRSGWLPGRPFYWMLHSAKLRLQGIDHNVLMEVSMLSNPWNQSQSLIGLAGPKKSRLDEMLTATGQTPVTKAYWDGMSRLMASLGATGPNLSQLLQYSVAFARSLYAQSPNTTLLDIMPLQTISGAIMEPSLGNFISDIVSDQVRDSDDIIVINQGYLFSTLKLLKSTNPYFLADYMMLRTVDSLWDMLSAQDTKQVPRADTCKKEIYSTLGVSLSSAYMKRFVAPETQHSGIELVEKIRDSVKVMINEASWISAATKSQAIIKADAIKANVAYIREMMDGISVERFYNNLQLKPDRFLENALELRRQTYDVAYSLLRGNQHIKDWQLFSRSLKVNAFYMPSANSINILPSIMQDGAFNVSRPNYLNYGGLGAIIGHEILHAFDNTGARFDKDGNYRAWWDQETANGFANRAECLAKQYDGKPIEGTNVRVDGRKTLGENIADNGGYEVSLRAYRKWVQANGPEQVLPGLGLSQEQLFWVSMATTWCSSKPAKQVAEQSLWDVHSPNKFRVNYPASNLKDFSDAFNCPPGSPMNPINKCELW